MMRYNHWVIDAFSEGRVCSRCGWIISKKNWGKGYRLCGGCFDALKGVNVNYGHERARDEIEDKTGEM
jgi:hypothetical protein